MKEIHPLTEFIPERADQGEVSWSIAQDGGVREPVVLYEGKVIEGRVRQRAAFEVGTQPQYKDWVLIADGDPLDWMVRKHVKQHQPSELERIKLVAAILPYYRARPGATERQIREATGVSNRKIRAIDWLQQAGKLDPVLRGEIDVLDAGRSIGVVAEKRGVALGRSYGHGDRFDEAVQPLKRYLTAWGRKDYEFRHLNPKEASRRLQIIDQLVEALGAARKDIALRSREFTLSAPPERKEKRE